MSNVNQNREIWLQRVAKELESDFNKLGHPLPPYRIGVGFPSTGRKSKRAGECWDATASADKTSEIILHPGHSDPMDVAGMLVHELVHSAVGVGAKHGPVFKKLAADIGLRGKMRSTTVGEDLQERLKEIIAKVGEYPHASLNTERGPSSRGPKQKGRMMKASCPECQYIIRASKSCLEIGVPACPNPECGRSYQGCSQVVPMLIEEQDATEETESEPE